MKLGLDQIRQLKKLKGKSIGVLCHAASVDSKYQHILDCLKGFKIKALFGPEHGIWGVAQDMEAVERVLEPISKIPVHSLYGSDVESLKPRSEWLEGLDAVICDLQDVGSRYYTFIYSVALMMQACTQAGVPVYVLDRPNPINGMDVEGGEIQKGYESFVGLYSLPNRHGMTLGEMVVYLNEVHEIGADLTVLKLQGWSRKKYLDEFNAAWVLPSPNMPTLETAIVYPGMCLLEATEISEGRGTTRPFEIFGAPYVKPEKLKNYLNDLKLKGVYFRPLFFKPSFQKCAGQICGGLQIHVTDRKKFKPYLTGLAIVKAIHDLYSSNFSWREKPYEFVREIPAIDLLTGSDLFRKQLIKSASWKEIVQSYEEGKSVLLKQRREYLLY